MRNDTMSTPGVNALAGPLVEELVTRGDVYRVAVSHSAEGARIVDAGIAVPGGLETGRLVAEICMGGLGRVQFVPGDDAVLGLGQVQVASMNPVLACLASQYAGWSLSDGEGKGAFHALASGPGRALARREPLFDELGYADAASRACFVLEVDKPPPEAIVAKAATACGLAPSALTFVLTPTRSLAGTVQIVARVLEVALHKAHALHFPLAAIVDGIGTAPVAPPAPDFVAAMGRTNDAILFGGFVTLYVDAEDEAARALAGSLPASASRDYGQPFAKVFKAYGYDFYKIDPMLFAPAEVLICNLRTGSSFRGGRRDPDKLRASFGL